MDHHQPVAVVGAGAMGTGFAVHFALRDRDVTLIDHRKSNLDDARDELASIVRFLNEQGLTETTPTAVRDRIDATLDFEAGVDGAGVVLETVAEDLAVKREVFEMLGSATTEAVLATNTSSLSVTDVAEGTPQNADRVVGCHWWYPPYLLRPVEVVAGEQTSSETKRRMTEFVESVDRDPVVVERDVPGFVWNRIQFAVLRECMHLVDEGVASAADVNRAVRDGYARRTAVIGPFETVDVAGLELFRTIAEELYPHLCDADEPSALFDEYVGRGRGGIDDGAGFFDYERSPDAITRDRDDRLAALSRLLDAQE